MFKLFRRNCLYNESIDPHCAYCAHCKPDNEYQGVCEYRGIVAMAGSCRRFEYDALRRKPPKPARIRGRFTDADFYFIEQEDEEPVKKKQPEPEPETDTSTPQEPLFTDDLSQFADLWEDDEPVSSEQEQTSVSPVSEETTDQEIQEDQEAEENEV